jgi:hypothetical protein
MIMSDVTHLSSGPIQEYVDEIERQRAKQQAPKSDEWEAGFNKGAKIGREIAHRRGHRVPDQTQGA